MEEQPGIEISEVGSSLASAFYGAQGLIMQSSSNTASFKYYVASRANGGLDVGHVVSIASVQSNWAGKYAHNSGNVLSSLFPLSEEVLNNMALVGGVLTPKEHRGKGYASKVMECVVGEHPQLCLRVRRTNTAAYSMYKKLNFVPQNKPPYIESLPIWMVRC